MPSDENLQQPRSSEVATPSSIGSYFLVLDMNGLLLEKKKFVAGSRRRFVVREGVEEFLEACIQNFEVVFWSACNRGNLNAMFEEIANYCSPQCMAAVRACRIFDQDWCDPIVTAKGTHVQKGPHFWVKPLDTLFGHADGLKGTGATPDNTLLIDDSPHKNVKNNMWNAIHPLPYNSSIEGSGSNFFRNELLPWLMRLKESGQTVPRFCEMNPSFGQSRLLPDEKETLKHLSRCGRGRKALELA